MEYRLILFDMVSFLFCYNPNKCTTNFNDNGNKFELNVN